MINATLNGFINGPVITNNNRSKRNVIYRKEIGDRYRYTLV